jgi:hypothetical protein
VQFRDGENGVPTGPGAANWWLDQLWLVKSGITAYGAPDEDRAGQAREAAAVIEGAEEAKAWSAADLLAQRARLFLLVAGADLEVELPAEFAPARLAAEVLAALPYPLDVVRARTAEWPGLPAAAVQELRTVRLDVRLAGQLAPYVDDESLRQRIAAWSALDPDLP